jgi:hypothetical protein
MARSATYGVMGLMCVRCVVSAIEEVRALPGVHGVGVDLVPLGESFVTVIPARAATSEEVRASLSRAGFEYLGRRPNHRHHWAGDASPYSDGSRSTSRPHRRA